MWLRFGKLLFLLLMSILTGHKSVRTEICLYTEFGYAGVLGATHFPSGAYSEITYSFALPTPVAGALSPDGTKLAVVDNYDGNGFSGQTAPIHVSVKSFPPPHIFGDPLSYYIPPEDPMIQVAWSPDGRLLAYHWEVDKKHYLGLSDANGKQLRWTEIAGNQDVHSFLNGWSADGKYLALIHKLDWQWNHKVNLSFFSIPDLAHLDADATGLLSSSSCAAFSTVEDTCAVWSPVGHQVAYVISARNPFQVVMTTLGTTEKHIFDVQFPAKAQPVGIYLKWSPDAQYVAAAAASQVGQDSQGTLMDAKLDIFGMDDTKQENIASVAMENIATVGYEPDMTNKVEWTADSKSIVYVREPQRQNKADVHIYNLATQTDRLLYETEKSNQIYVFPSPDGKSVAVDQFINGEDLFDALLISQNGSWMKKLPPAGQYTRFLWAPDRPVVAIVDNRNGTVIGFYTSAGLHLFTKTIPVPKTGNREFSGEAAWGNCKQPYIFPY